MWKLRNCVKFELQIWHSVMLLLNYIWLRVDMHCMLIWFATYRESVKEVLQLCLTLKVVIKIFNHAADRIIHGSEWRCTVCCKLSTNLVLNVCKIRLQMYLLMQHPILWFMKDFSQMCIGRYAVVYQTTEGLLRCLDRVTMDYPAVI